MSFLRAAARASPATRAAFAAPAKRYSTTPPPKKDSNLPYWLMGAGIAGISLYIYTGWDDRKAAFQAVDQKAQQLKEGSPLDPKEFINLKLKSVEPYNYNVDKYIFELPADTASRLPISSCVLLRAADPAAGLDKNGKPAIRPYTPTSPSDLPGELEFIIKRYEGGAMSQHVHTLKPGDEIAIKGPLPKFPYKANEFDEVAMIAGGSGITPMYQILQHALADPNNKTKFKLLFGNVAERDILLKSEFDELTRKHPDTFEVVHVLGTAPEGWTGATGYITKELMKAQFGGPEMREKIKVLVCGPPPQVAAIAGKKEGMKQGALGGALQELGYDESQVFKF